MCVSVFVVCFCGCCGGGKLKTILCITVLFLLRLLVMAALLLWVCLCLFVCLFALMVGGYCFCSWLEYWTDKRIKRERKIKRKSSFSIYVFALEASTAGGVKLRTCSTRTVMVRHWVINRGCLFLWSLLFWFTFMFFFFSSRRWCLIVWFWVIFFFVLFCLSNLVFVLDLKVYLSICVFLMICFWFPVVVYNLDIIVSFVYALSFFSRDDDFSSVYIWLLHELCVSFFCFG